ncbi:hypothetical protein I6E72_05890 [Pseudoalteromonas sp. NSLLW24]|uniref:hypothetical protein n=1 Tax=unclassified Pseudoalteromonas TaxID=194690 RepID=UPI0018CD342B|nr:MULTISPECIES: hypothetical protein [unclassified Pseudoalteromonas]MBG9998491.1 hypothetical protein [Pseudoalteromonas sp. NSLLW24]MBH0079582.1 hypothetical protein [Pseudoalteromonas sp. NZS11]
MSISYGWEKLYLAIDCLTSEGDQISRLVDAVSFNLAQITSENDLPEALKQRFDDLMESFRTVQPLEDEGLFRATINSFTGMERKAAIEEIISLYSEICKHKELD